MALPPTGPPMAPTATPPRAPRPAVALRPSPPPPSHRVIRRNTQAEVDSRQSTAVELPDPEALKLSTVDCRLSTVPAPAFVPAPDTGGGPAPRSGPACGRPARCRR